MDAAGFHASLDGAAPPSGLSMAAQALWWDGKGDWDRAHAAAQADAGPLGCAVHAYLHRKEPDLANARYWYGRAGRTPATGTLAAEWQALVAEALATT